MPALMALVPVAVLVAAHLLATHLRGLAGRHEAAVVSAAGGISVAYVFLHLLPEVAAGARVVGESVEDLLVHVALQELLVFLVALAGFTVFYVAERYAAQHGSARHGGPGASSSAFGVHLAAFAAYNVAVAYTLPERVAEDPLSAAVFTLAVAVHVLVVDRGLDEHHPRRYGRVGRFVLAGALLLGWLLAAVAAPTSSLTVSLMTAVVAGSVLLTVFQEELPRARESRTWPFLAGLGGNALLLLALAVLEPATTA
ncbi:membrane protein [Actinotalea ferrariae CF5-4]|uniref:Membrane protein n=1 Tax=Actinotalea ferrariae CF5-4 TaxID=948458 RepID=A0A021VT33_9CELL|nr:hypothetical protein [Actinotalea ferrariae]EYR64311.1 membrane protein [Actinotalea ferrariae CF5-4]